MSKIKKTEEFVYAAVISGELEIMPDGTIWRVRMRTGNRWRPGTFRTVPVERRRAEHLVPLGYLQVRLMVAGKRMSASAHRLVYRHFQGPIPDGLTINHKDGDKSHNAPTNLELATDSEQIVHMQDVLRKGRTKYGQRGEANLMAKLTDAQVVEIRRRRSEGERLSSIAKDFGVVFQTISRIALHQRR